MSKLIAFYLPQYHPIPENDLWWGKGFTEWTNVAKARPLFKDHIQPSIPADLGFYDLRLPEVREAQASLARENGIYGFCYYHYWFGNGKQLLERPFNEVIESGKPDFPFMLCWANQTWKGVWFGASKGEILIEQKYPGADDYVRHFKYLIKAFSDKRYIKIDEKPVFLVYMPLDIPDLEIFVKTFRDCSKKAGFEGIYLMGTNCPENWNPELYGFDGVLSQRFREVRYRNAKRFFLNRSSFVGKIETKIRFFFGDQPIGQRTKPVLVDYRKACNTISDWPEVDFDYFPMVIPNWDNSPRCGYDSLILKNSRPEYWEEHLIKGIKYSSRYSTDKQFVFIKSWNEWAEGNYLEPDIQWGLSYLEATKKVLDEYDKRAGQ